MFSRVGENKMPSEIAGDEFSVILYSTEEKITVIKTLSY